MRSAALKGFASGLPDDMAVTRVLVALKGDDRPLQIAAGQAAGDIRSVGATRMLLASLPDLPPYGQMLLIRAMAKRGDRAALAAVTKACGSSDAGVRVAALEALGALGDAASVPTLLKAIAQGTEPEQAAARASLAGLRAENVNGALLSRLNDVGEKVEIIRSLASRNAAEAVPALLKMARSDSVQVRSVALDGLQELAGAEHIPALVDLLADADARDRNQVRKMLVAVARRCKAETQAAQGLAAKQGGGAGEVRSALLLALGDLGDGSGLPVLRKALDDDQETIRRAAITALSGWPNSEPLPDLQRIARGSGCHRQGACLARVHRPCGQGDCDETRGEGAVL